MTTPAEAARLARVARTAALDDVDRRIRVARIRLARARADRNHLGADMASSLIDGLLEQRLEITARHARQEAT